MADRRYMLRESLKQAIDRLKAEGQIVVTPETPEQRAAVERELRAVFEQRRKPRSRRGTTRTN
jgi:hypothetical protein